MSAKILNGKPIALKIQRKLKKEIQQLILKYQTKPKLVALQLKDDAGIQSYINVQRRIAQLLSIDYKLYRLDKKVDEKKVIDKIKKLNSDKTITAIVILLPFPSGINTENVIERISWTKDVEGIHPQNLGRLIYRNSWMCKNYNFSIPCTAQAVMELLKAAGLKDKKDFRGKETVVVGHSEIIGKPIALMLLDKLATVTICHIGTGKLKRHIQRAEIVISAAGKPNLIKAKWIKKGAVIIDVGTSKEKGRITGDVEFDKAKSYASYITPVPGGVGPLTVTMLMKNLVCLFKLQKQT